MELEQAMTLTEDDEKKMKVLLIML